MKVQYAVLHSQNPSETHMCWLNTAVFTTPSQLTVVTTSGSILAYFGNTDGTDNDQFYGFTS